MALNIPWDEWAVLYRKIYRCSKRYQSATREYHIQQARVNGSTNTGVIQQFMQRCLFADKET